MTVEQKAALIMARAAVLNAQVAGMIAENQMRMQRDEAIAYDDEAFERLIDKSNLREDSLVAFFELP